MKNMAFFGLGSYFGLIAFLSVVPLIILYLIKPKPVKMSIPSLMFFSKHSKIRKADVLFNYLSKYLLFLIQLLVLLLLSFSLAQPWINQNKDIASSNVVFILDVSASSQVKEANGLTRLDISKGKIKELATKSNSLILVKSTPLLALKNVGKSELNRFVNKIQSSDDTTDIGDAMILAGDLLQDNKGRVVVLSDFAVTKGMNVELAKNILEGKGIHVDFINVASNKNVKNIGIVNLVVAEDITNVYVKNYNIDNKNFKLKINKDIYDLNVGKWDIEPFVFKTPEGITEINLINEDDFAVDNKVFVNSNLNQKVKVLHVSNEVSKFLDAALKTIPNVEVTYAKPPVISKDDFDVYIVDNIDKNKLLKGSFNNMISNLRNGGNIIILMQGDSDKIDYTDFKFFDIVNKTKCNKILINQINKVTKDVDFGDTGDCFNLDNFNGNVLVSSEETPLIIMKKEGKGNLVYYGILEEGNGFKLSPSYPIFWSNLIKYLSNLDDLVDINLEVGSTVTVGEKEFILSDTGVVEFGDREYAVNLLDEKESDISPKELEFEEVEPIKDFKFKELKEDVEYDLLEYFIWLVLILVLLEIVYVKWRGDI